MNFANKTEFKRFHESEAAFFARRETRAIRQAARHVDPNSGFRLINKNAALADKLRTAANRMENVRQQEREAKAALKKRDVKIAGKSVEAMHRRTGRI